MPLFNPLLRNFFVAHILDTSSRLRVLLLLEPRISFGISFPLKISGDKVDKQAEGKDSVDLPAALPPFTLLVLPLLRIFLKQILCTFRQLNRIEERLAQEGASHLICDQSGTRTAWNCRQSSNYIKRCNFLNVQLYVLSFALRFELSQELKSHYALVISTLEWEATLECLPVLGCLLLLHSCTIHCLICIDFIIVRICWILVDRTSVCFEAVLILESEMIWVWTA